MKFSQNGLYIDRYIKCVNCGQLVYVDDERQKAEIVRSEKGIFCSKWCVDWAQARDAREKAQA